MLTQLIIPADSQLQILTAIIAAQQLQVELVTTALTACCSACCCAARRVHSHYQRTLADLPLAKLPVRLLLRVRRFYCDNPDCAKRTFSEPVPNLVLPFARRTSRLAAEQRQLGLDIGGELGARTALRQGMPISGDTILRLVRNTPPMPVATPRKIGIDDFALRKGHRYGTILVDLEKHCPIDLLPDRSAATLAAWLQQHPGIELIARDRASDYADAATRAAPTAVQVADRFHLCQNLRDTLVRLLLRHQAALRLAVKIPADQARTAPPVDLTTSVSANVSANLAGLPLAASMPAEPQPQLTKAALRKQATRANRLARYQTVRQLYASGYSLRDIAQQLQLGRNTVRELAAAAEYPEVATRRAAYSILAPWIPYLQQQLCAGSDNGLALWRQLRDEQGYTGSRTVVTRWITEHRHLCPAPSGIPAKPRSGARPKMPPKEPRQEQRRCSVRQASFLLVRRREELGQDDQALVERLLKQEPELQQGVSLSDEFLTLLRERRGERLDDWLQRAEASKIAELQNFAAGLRRDYAAVRAGLTLADNSGQVEGQVNRLKFIKRSGYGRAKFDLLRQRVLAT